MRFIGFVLVLLVVGVMIGTMSPSTPPTTPTPVVQAAKVGAGPDYHPKVYGPLTVEITAKADGLDRPNIVGSTNLPDGASLLVSLNRPQAKYGAQAKAKVANGAFTAGPFSAHGAALPPGEYQVDITFPLAFTQSPEVQAIVGRQNENLAGPLVEKSDLGVTAALKTQINIGGAASAAADAKSIADHTVELKRSEKENEAKNRWALQVLSVRALRRSMKNPDSFKLEEATELDDGTLCLTYRATNSFNAVVPGQAVLSPTGSVTSDDDRQRFAARWNATCAKKPGKDIIYIRQAL